MVNKAGDASGTRACRLQPSITGGFVCTVIAQVGLEIVAAYCCYGLRSPMSYPRPRSSKRARPGPSGPGFVSANPLLADFFARTIAMPTVPFGAIFQDNRGNFQIRQRAQARQSRPFRA